MNNSPAARFSAKTTQPTIILLIFCILLVCGHINLYSAAHDTSYWQTQLSHLVISFIVFGGCALFIPLVHLNSYGYLFYGLSLLLQVLVLVTGHEAGGAQRWLDLAGLRFQPSEFAKLALIVAVAKFFAFSRHSDSYRLRDLWLLIIMVSLLFLSIFVQPDLGTAGICLVIAVAQLFFVNIERRSVVIAILSAVLATVSAWQFLLRDYQKLRVLNLLNPNLDPHGSGYNSWQAIIAVGSGQVAGKGFLQGSQSQLQFLPARHTDFAFAVFAEEHGFLGAMLVIVLFSAITYVGIQIAKSARDTFSCLLAIGLTTKIFVEFAINNAMIIGIFPVVGTPLPFFSFGGSSLVASSATLGLLIAVARNSRTVDHRKWQ